jgi:hypothetical protein
MMDPQTPPPSTESKQHALSPPVAHVDVPQETIQGSGVKTGRASEPASEAIVTEQLHPQSVM